MEKLKFIGIGGSVNIELGGNCCYIKDEKNLLIIDCCESATEKFLKEQAFDNVDNIYIAITHTHYDHIAGLGVFIWYCNFNLNIKPHILYSNKKYKKHITNILKLTGVDINLVDFIKDNQFELGDLTLELKSTSHTPLLECYGIMFTDKYGKYYYTGDTNDINYLRILNNDVNVKLIYCEVAEETYNAHILYDDIIKLNKEKFILMHFDTMNLYKKAIKDKMNIGNI